MQFLAWLFRTRGFHSWSSTGWSAPLLLLHRAGDLMTVATFLLTSAVLAWGAAATTEQDRSKTKSWWKLILFFLASAAVEILTITVLLGVPVFNALGVAKLATGIVGLFILTPAVFAQVKRLRSYVAPEVLEAETQRAESAETLARSKTREAARLLAEVREMQEKSTAAPPADIQEFEETVNQLRWLVRAG